MARGLIAACRESLPPVDTSNNVIFPYDSDVGKRAPLPTLKVAIDVPQNYPSECTHSRHSSNSLDTYPPRSSHVEFRLDHKFSPLSNTSCDQSSSLEGIWDGPGDNAKYAAELAGVCPVSLVGLPCNLRACERPHLCIDWHRDNCKLPREHFVGSRRVLHIRRSCKFFTECANIKDGGICPMAHDYQQLRVHKKLELSLIREENVRLNMQRRQGPKKKSRRQKQCGTS